MKTAGRIGELPEVTRYTKYYEHDGMLRAYAKPRHAPGNDLRRACHRLTGVRDIRPHSASDGDPRGTRMATLRLSAGPCQQGGNDQPICGRFLWRRSYRPRREGVVRQFLHQYLAYTQDSVDRNLAEALNMMTANLRVYSMNKLRDEDTVERL